MQERTETLSAFSSPVLSQDEIAMIGVRVWKMLQIGGEFMELPHPEN